MARGEFPFVLHIRDGRKPEENIRPVISNVDAALRVGEDCTLTAVLTNASQYADLTNLMLHVTDASGDVLPAGTDALLLSDMTAGSTQAVSVPLKVKADAAVSLHTLRFDLSWTALDAAGTWSESFTLPINQEIRLEQGGVQMASTILQGDMATLTIPLMNMGRADLNNVMATLSLPGITERQSVLVGTIAPGETKQAKLTFYPGTDALGLHQGTVTMTGEDAYGNMTTLTERVETTVEAPAPAVVVANGTMGEKAQPVTWMVILLGSSCCVLIILLMIDGTRLRKKIRKLEEERL